MSKPISTTTLLKQLKKWGVKYAEVSGWKTRGRPASTGPWSDLKGVMWHHTGGDVKESAADDYARGLLAKGRSDLPGPLCQVGISPNGVAHLVGWGRANHAGLGDPDVLNAVINENYGASPPRDNQSSVDGNRSFYGWEIMYSGSHGMTPAAYECALRLTCAILDYHGWSSKSVIAHGEWQPGKWDPGYKPGTMMNMAAVRNDIATMLASGGKDDKPDRKLEWLEVKGYLPELRHGDSNWHVDWLQRNLNRFLSPNIKVDGYYGDTTAKAVDTFYAKYLSYETTTNGRVFGADGWRRVLSINDKKG